MMNIEEPCGIKRRFRAPSDDDEGDAAVGVKQLARNLTIMQLARMINNNIIEINKNNTTKCAIMNGAFLRAFPMFVPRLSW